MNDPPLPSKRIALLHARQDDAFYKELHKHLGVVARRRHAEIWDRTRISPGEPAADVVAARIAEADLVVVLLSVDYLHEHLHEVDALLSGPLPGASRLVPVLARACPWEETALGALEIFPSARQPLSGHAPRRRQPLSGHAFGRPRHRRRARPQRPPPRARRQRRRGHPPPRPGAPRANRHPLRGGSGLLPGATAHFAPRSLP